MIEHNADSARGLGFHVIINHHGVQMEARRGVRVCPVLSAAHRSGESGRLIAATSPCVSGRGSSIYERLQSHRLLDISRGSGLRWLGAPAGRALLLGSWWPMLGLAVLGTGCERNCESGIWGRPTPARLPGVIWRRVCKDA